LPSSTIEVFAFTAEGCSGIAEFGDSGPLVEYAFTMKGALLGSVNSMM
jgi:hypothetical protein